MIFNQAVYEAILKKINEGIKKLQENFDAFIDKVNWLISLAKYLAQWLFDRIQAAVDLLLKAINAVIQLISKFVEEGFRAPILFYNNAADWKNNVKHPMKLYASSVTPDKLVSSVDWEGRAGTYYREAAADQNPAGEACATIADQMGTTLNACAVAGLAFYTAIGISLAKLIAGLVASAVAASTVVGAPVAAATSTGTAALVTGEIIAASAALLAFLGTQASTISDVTTAFSDFPFSHWPSGTSRK